jgi:hypothetical protein
MSFHHRTLLIVTMLQHGPLSIPRALPASPKIKVDRGVLVAKVDQSTSIIFMKSVLWMNSSPLKWQEADTTTLFDVADGSSGGTRINTVFGQLASFTNPDFPGMETALNGLEGSLWNAGLQGAPKSPANTMANNPRSLAFPQQPMLAFTKPSKEMITSSRTTVGNVKDHENRPFSATWANAYSTWMTDKIASQSQMITTTAAAMLCNADDECTKWQAVFRRCDCLAVNVRIEFQRSIHDQCSDVSCS